ncbi:uncharacterized protein [Nicotiana sylvestris]|uniref:uncharacterized protein n=1 Tax=Nicotiana sylvestris TaxID=4096 RepID=UPI00388C96F6
MIHSSETSSKEKVTSGKSVVQLKEVGNKPVVVTEKGSSSTVAVKPEKAKVVVPGVTSKPIVVVKGARIKPVIIKPVTQLPMINSKVVPWNYERVIVTYKGKEVKEEVCETHGLTRSGRCFAPEELRKAKTSKDNPVLVKKAVTEEEAEEFLRKMKVQDYSIVEQLRKTPAQISLLSLLIHSDEHLRALMKILNEAHVPDKISVNHLEKIANKIFEVNRVTFSDDELPMEGTEHNRALYLTVKCEDSVVTRVLNVVVSYNLLLGRTWIYAAKAVPSTLHQMVKFEWDRQEIVIHGEDNLCVPNDVVVPLIEVDDDKGPWIYQIFDTVSVEKILEGNCVPTPKMVVASVMVAVEMLKNVSLPKNLDTFGLGFKPTVAYVRRARKMRQKAWTLPKPIPRMSKSFVRPGIRKHLLLKVPGSLIGANGDLEKGLERLFAEEFDDDKAYEEISKELSHFKEKPKPNLNDTKAVNLGDQDNFRETKISVHLEPQLKEEIIKALFEYKDVFAWSYDDMPGLSTDLVIRKFPTDSAFPPVKQKLRNFKTDMSVKIKEEKDGKTKVCVDYRDLNKASLKDDFPLSNIHILIDNCAKHEIGSFVDCYAGYHQILMDEEDVEKTAFITP